MDDNKQSLTNTDKEKATVLGNYFCTVFTEEIYLNMPEIIRKNVPELL
jgi:hypothetical protein